MIEIDMAIEELLTEEQIQDAFQKRFFFPEYYGRNLDALYDELSVIMKETRLVIHGTASIERLPKCTRNLFHMLEDVARENDHLVIVFERG